MRYLRTISYLKPVQILYQCKYRTFGYKYLDNLRNNNREIKEYLNISNSNLDLDSKYIDRFKVDNILMNQITLLNDATRWDSGKWFDESKTHLWNFNLHYFEYGIALAAAYTKSSNYKYIHKLEDLYMNWHKNAYINRNADAWHPYTISLRLKNLLITLDIVKKKNLSRTCFEVIENDIYCQYVFLQKNLEKNLLGNHYFENLVTVFICSLAFCETAISEQFAKLLKIEIKEQILPDGMHFERSFMYHNLILEDLLRSYLAIKSANYLDPELLDIIEMVSKRMCDVCFSFERDEERLPGFNDAGSNVAKTSTQLINACKYIFEYEPNRIYALKNAGYYHLENKYISLIFDCGAFAPCYISGHGHCDALSFELYYKDEPILVNSGTYNYQTDKRAYFRSTEAHNGLRNVKYEQSECWGEHRTARRIGHISISLCENGIFGRIQDYKKNQLSRSIKIEDSCMEIEDDGNEDFVSYWHIHPDNSVVLDENGNMEVITPKGIQLRACLDNSCFIPFESYYSEQFGFIQKCVSYKTSSRKIIIKEI